MKQCSECKYFNRLYMQYKSSETFADGYYAVKYGVCESKNKIIGSRYICTKYKDKEAKDEYKQ